MATLPLEFHGCPIGPKYHSFLGRLIIAWPFVSDAGGRNALQAGGDEVDVLLACSRYRQDVSQI
jgi:hypothetical protein